jgi:quercetin dioxygenase-like cupin family protein
MRPGAVMGRHFHRLTDVFFFLVAGQARVTEVDVRTGAERRTELRAGEGLWLHPNVAHAIRFERQSSFLMLKSRRYDRADPDTFEYEVPV